MTSLRQRSAPPWAGRERPGRARNRGRERTSRIDRDRAITLGFVALAFALAFWQHPGWATADTKIDLHVDPVRFLSQVASVWTSTTDLGEVHSAQYSGYLWPMGPFFAALHSIGLGAWVVQRIWLGLMYGFSVWGMLKLLDVLVGRPRGTVHVVAAGFYLLNPYVVVFTARTSITLLGYAALPWLLLITYHGLRAAGRWRGWRGWWWAAAFAAVLASTGGGVNAAVVGWMLVGLLVLGLYEPAMGTVRWRDAGRFLVMAGVLSVLASLWWIVPLLVHVRYGIDFLQFTEQPGTIWGTNSVTENLRLMGYWTSYIGVGFGVTRPYFSDGLTMMFNPLVVGASLLLPACAIAAFVRARRLSYGPFLLLLIVVGVVIETAGFPNGTPMRGAMDWVYHHVFVLRFMRTTNKAAPLVAVGVGGLLGLGVRQALEWLRTLRRPRLRTAALVAVPVALAGLLVLAALPLVRGDAIDKQLQFKRIAPAWVAAGHNLDSQLPQNSRAMVLPGQIFAFYKWGGTLDAILPRLTSRPVAVRYETPYSDLHAVDLLTTVDNLVQQRRLVPGELKPLLGLMGVGTVVTGTDDDLSRSGAIDPAAAAPELTQQLGNATHSYGPVSKLPAAAGDVGPAVSLPEVRSYGLAPGRGIVHVDPTGPATIVDGGAQSLADMAAFGALPSTRPILYAGDMNATIARREAAAGANLVVGDSNRRREFLAQSTQQDLGATLGQNQPLVTGAAVINPFPATGASGQTVSVLDGARYLRAPSIPGELQFPENGPIAAFDGDTSTAWVADRLIAPSQRWIEVGFNAPRDVPYVDVDPLSDAHGVVTQVDVNGVRHAVGRGFTRIRVNLHHVSRLRVTIDHVDQPKVGLGGPGGFREVRIPGFHVQQLLRPPVLIGRDLAGTDLRHDSLSYVFERTTGDDPFRRNPYGTATVLNDPQDRGDAEAQIGRLVFAPAARSYSAQAWVYPAVNAADSTLDRLAGYTGPERFDSSSRFQDQPAYRASSAFSGRPGAGWIGLWAPAEAPDPWISWTTPRPLRLSSLRLTPSSRPVRRPTLVRISWPGGSSGPLGVGADGTVALPSAVTARSFRVTVLRAAFPATATGRQRQARAVGIGSVSVAGIKPVAIPVSGPLHAPCGTVAVSVGGRRVPLAPRGTVAELDAGKPLPATGCGAATAGVPMGAGVQRITSLPGAFSVDLLRLSSPAPSPVVPPVSGGRVVDPGHIGQSSVTGVQVALNGPSWLVLGESFDSGWRASCDGRSLGAPRVLDGYGNGWLAPAGCKRVSFEFAPQSGVNKSYVISAVAAALILLFLLVGAMRRPTPAAEAARRLLPDVPAHPRPLARAAALALPAAIVLGYVFSIRAGIGLLLVLTFVLWRGWAPPTLTLIATALLGIAVPLTYLIVNPHDRHGDNFVYSTKLIAAHWIGVAAIALLALVCWKIVRYQRAERDVSPPGPR
ncbi:MAG: alpha-(1-_3)-arabinofuranosyltransferase domain-containing protein [Solirubrobacteraceae bacterium]